MKPYILAIIPLVTACSTVNPFVAGAINSSAADYAASRANLQKIDDAQLKLAADSACDVKLGALERAESTTGNSNITRAMLMLCPISGVGVTTVLPTGNINVQTTNANPKP